MGAAESRLHGIDAIRGLALTLGVVLHATMSFFPGPGIWVVTDTQRSATLSALFYVIHLLRMATFFLIAGYFARVLHARLGTPRFVRDRLVRIALPLVLWWPVSLGTIIAVAVAQSTGKATTAAPALSITQFPLTHLWFLYLLLWLYAGLLLSRAIVRVVDSHGVLVTVLDGVVCRLAAPWGIAVFALPVAWALYAHPYWLMWFGVPTPDMSLVPNRAALVTYGATFALGWMVQRQSADLLPRITRQWGWSLGLAVLATMASLWQVGVTPVLFPVAFGAAKARYALTYAVALWAWTFGLLGVGLRFLSGASPVRRYVADASYWIYLAHLPLVVTLQWLVAAWPVSWLVKLPLIVGATMAVLLISYHWLVRSTLIGAVLNGRRRPRSLASSTHS